MDEAATDARIPPTRNASRCSSDFNVVSSGTRVVDDLRSQATRGVVPNLSEPPDDQPT